jgi:iron complex outermembrane receptor protein
VAPVAGRREPRAREKSPSFGTPSTYAYTGNIIGQGPVPGCATVVNNLCRCDRHERFALQAASERVNALISARYRPSARLEGFAELLFSTVKTDCRSAFQTYGAALGTTIWVDPTTAKPNQP